MFEKKKKEKKSIFKISKKDVNYLLIVITFSVVLFLVLLFITMNLLLALMSGIATFFLLYYVIDGLSLNKKNKKLMQYEENKLSFYESFLLYSSLENDYVLGFKKALSSLYICELKDALTTYEENNFAGSIPLKETSSLIDNQITELIYTCIHEKQETDYVTLERLKDLIARKKEETANSLYFSFPVINIALAIYLLAFTLAFSLR